MERDHDQDEIKKRELQRLKNENNECLKIGTDHNQI